RACGAGRVAESDGGRGVGDLRLLEDGPRPSPRSAQRALPVQAMSEERTDEPAPQPPTSSMNLIAQEAIEAFALERVQEEERQAWLCIYEWLPACLGWLV